VTVCFSYCFLVFFESLTAMREAKMSSGSVQPSFLKFSAFRTAITTHLLKFAEELRVQLSRTGWMSVKCSPSSLPHTLCASSRTTQCSSSASPFSYSSALDLSFSHFLRRSFGAYLRICGLPWPARFSAQCHIRFSLSANM
jgi:hypothetical protein